MIHPRLLSAIALCSLFAAGCYAVVCDSADAGSDAATCRPCPAGAFVKCQADAGVEVVDCCTFDTSTAACARPAGILSHVCFSCSSNLCAVSPSGARTCCELGAPGDPCGAAVP